MAKNWNFSVLCCPTWNSVLYKVVSELPAAVGGHHRPVQSERVEEVGGAEARQHLAALPALQAGVGAGSHLPLLGGGAVETDWEQTLYCKYFRLLTEGLGTF